MNKKGIQGRFLKDEALMLKILKAVVSTFDWEEAVTARKRKEKKEKKRKKKQVLGFICNTFTTELLMSNISECSHVHTV